MKTIELAVSQIIPYEKNQRFNDGAVDAVAKSIQEFGFQQPLVLDKDYVVIVGHTRLKAAKKLGLEKVPCVIADNLNEEQVKAYRLADNKVGELAKWDFELLADELDEIMDIDMSQFEFEYNFDIEDEPDELEKESEKTGHVIISINVPTVSEWNLIENEIKRIADEVNASLAVKLE